MARHIRQNQPYTILLRGPKHVYTAILLALYAIIFGEYVRVYGLNVLRYAYYVVDSTNISIEKYVKAFRRLREVLEKARVKFIVLYWPIADIALTFFGRPRELVDWLKILPRNGLLICDREFGLEGLYMYVVDLILGFQLFLGVGLRSDLLPSYILLDS